MLSSRLASRAHKSSPGYLSRLWRHAAANRICRQQFSSLHDYLQVENRVEEALKNGDPVVALESTIVAHGMPFPQNLETAQSVESILRSKVRYNCWLELEASCCPALTNIVILCNLELTTWNCTSNSGCRACNNCSEKWILLYRYFWEWTKGLVQSGGREESPEVFYTGIILDLEQTWDHDEKCERETESMGRYVKETIYNVFSEESGWL